MPVLQFKGKTAVETYHYTVPHHTLEFDAKLSCLPKGEKPSLDGNLIIEGDNLLALKALLPTHAGKVKLIYIDPPYNTGNEGWVYNDNLTQPQFKEWIGKTVGKEGEDACRHDKWCCMMYPRLMLLKELLREDGAIFVSIDDAEVHSALHLLDEIFGEENHLATVVWQHSEQRKGYLDTFSVHHNYVIGYRRSGAFRLGALERTEQDNVNYSNPDNDPRGDWRPGDVRNALDRPNLKFDIETPSGKKIKPPANGWRWSRETIAKKIASGEIVFSEDETRIIRKIYLANVEGRAVETIWFGDDVGTTRDASETLKEIFGGVSPFETPKPVGLIRRILQIATSAEEKDIVLDSFAGSGTTAHAVLLQNADDGGERRFMLIQQPFDTNEQKMDGRNVSQSVTAERTRRVIEGYTYVGTKSDILFEERVTLPLLKRPEQFVARIDDEHKANEKKYDAIKRECKDGVVRLIGERQIKSKMPGVAGSFTFAHLSDKPLFGEYKDFGDKLPAYEDLAKYIFYTETSREFPGTNKKQNPAWDAKTGRIGEHGGRSYYLLYEPNERTDRGLDRGFLKNVAAKDPNAELVVYCEMLAVHADELRKFHREHGKKIRHMLVPFNLK